MKLRISFQDKKMYDYEKVKSARGQQIKVKVAGKYRRGIIVDTGKHKQTKDIFVKVRIDYMDMPWSATFQQVQWYPLPVVRKADKEKWIQFLKGLTMNRKQIFDFYTSFRCETKQDAFDFLSTLNANQLTMLEIDLYRAGFNQDDTFDIEWAQEAGIANCGKHYMNSNIILEEVK